MDSKRKIKIGIIFGIIVGILDIVPMILQDMPLNAILSAFSYWVVLGFLVSTTQLRSKGYINGLIFAVVTMIPIACLVWLDDNSAIIPMSISTILLGMLLGLIIDKYIHTK